MVDRLTQILSSIQTMESSVSKFKEQAHGRHSSLTEQYKSIIKSTKPRQSSITQSTLYQIGKERMRQKVEKIYKNQRKHVIFRQLFENTDDRMFLTQDLLNDNQIRGELKNKRRLFAFGKPNKILDKRKLIKSPPGSFVYDYRSPKPSRKTNTYVRDNIDRILHNNTYRQKKISLADLRHSLPNSPDPKGSLTGQYVFDPSSDANDLRKHELKLIHSEAILSVKNAIKSNARQHDEARERLSRLNMLKDAFVLSKHKGLQLNLRL